MNTVATDEKKPPKKVADTVTSTIGQQVCLIGQLNAVDAAFGVATRSARVCGEIKLSEALERCWDDYLVLLAPLHARVPAKLFE